MRVGLGMGRAVVALAAVGCCALVPGARAAAPPGEWVAGDLHVHTTYSHDSYGGPTDDNTSAGDAYTLGHSVTSQFTVAAARGLDFMAITDHNDIRSQTAPGFGAGGVIPIPAYENSISGHAQMLGARRLYANGDKGVEAAKALAAALHSDGGVFQANHPADPRWEYGYEVPVDSVEAWNLPWYYQPPFPAASDNDTALRYWEGWLDRGAHVALTGGSDNHYVATSGVQGAGQPTTWVYVHERNVAGVLDGLRAGRTYVSHEPPAYAGPGAFVEGDADHDGTYESMVGDTVPAGAALRVRVMGAPGAMLRLVGDGGRQLGATVAVDGPSFERRFTVPAGTSWVHAEVYGEDLQTQRDEACAAVFGADLGEQTTYCKNRVAMLALTSALYLRAASAGTPGGRPASPGRAPHMRVPRGCRQKPFWLSVRGRRIGRVRFAIDAGRPTVVPHPDSRGRFRLRVAPRRLSGGPHRVVARVNFASGARRSPVALSGRFRTCAGAAPTFTG